MTFLRQRWPVFFLCAVMLLFFWQYFLLDQVLYAGDSVFVMTPFRQFVHDSISKGELPLWNPYLLGGTPGFAEAQYQVFYLPNAIFFLLGVPRGMAWLLPLHLLFMSIGTYLFCRQALHLDRAPAVFAAVAFSFGGYIQSRLGTWVYVEAVAWLPWMLWFYNRALDGKCLSWAWVGVALALQICVGGPQFSYYTLALIAAWHLYRWLEMRRAESDSSENENRNLRRNFQKRWLIFPLVILLGAGLATGQVLPQLELGRFSARGVNATYEYVTQFSLAPTQFLVTSVFPGYYGLFDEAPRDGFVPAEETSYLGLLTLALIVVALLLAKPRRAVGFWSLVALVSLAVSFGAHNPLYPFLYRFVPGFAIFRGPARCLVLTCFAGAILGAMGLQAILNRLPERKPGVLPARETSRFQLRSVLCVLALLVLSADLFQLSQRMEMQHTLSVAAIEAPSETAKFLHAQAGRTDDFSERFWSRDAQLPMEKWQSPNALPGASAQEFRGLSSQLMRNTMLSCMPAEFQVQGLTAAWGGLMPLSRHALPLYEPDISTEAQLHWLRLLNVRHHLFVQSQTNTTLHFEKSGPPFIYRDDAALPRAFWIGNAERVATADVLARVSSLDFDPSKTVVLETKNPSQQTSSAVSKGTNFQAATIAFYSPQRVSLEVDAPRDGHLVLMDTFLPAWRATLDGRETQIEPANWMGRAVAVPAGSHRVTMWYEPQSVRLGIFISLVTLMFLSGAVAASWGLRRQADVTFTLL